MTNGPSRNATEYAADRHIGSYQAKLQALQRDFDLMAAEQRAVRDVTRLMLWALVVGILLGALVTLAGMWAISP